jgi:hypothetical protein
VTLTLSERAVKDAGARLLAHEKACRACKRTLCREGQRLQNLVAMQYMRLRRRREVA